MYLYRIFRCYLVKTSSTSAIWDSSNFTFNFCGGFFSRLFRDGSWSRGRTFLGRVCNMLVVSRWENILVTNPANSLKLTKFETNKANQV